MTTKVPAPAYDLQIVDSQLRQLREFNDWVDEVNRSIPILGEGSPEEEVSAVQGQLYVDTAGDAGSILYVKKLPGISGDDTQGWIVSSAVSETLTVETDDEDETDLTTLVNSHTTDIEANTTDIANNTTAISNMSSISMIRGSGDPEGRVIAVQNTFYMCLIRSELYLKFYASENGDTTKGWVKIK